MNQCHFFGNLVRDPELKQTQNSQVVKFAIAVNRRYKKDGQPQQEVAFLNCEAWDTGAEVIAKYFKKGDPIIVHCSVKQDNWTAQDGTKRSALVFRVNGFDFVQGRRDRDDNDAGGDDNGGSEPAQNSAPPRQSGKKRPPKDDSQPRSEEDIPF